MCNSLARQVFFSCVPQLFSQAWVWQQYYTRALKEHVDLKEEYVGMLIWTKYCSSGTSQIIKRWNFTWIRTFLCKYCFGNIQDEGLQCCVKRTLCPVPRDLQSGVLYQAPDVRIINPGFDIKYPSINLRFKPVKPVCGVGKWCSTRRGKV